MTITIRDLTKTYKGGVTALSGVNVEIPAGMFGLLGPNGAGKSTMIKILATLLEPTSGEVTIDGLDVSKDRRKIRSRLGYLPQEFGAWRLHRVEEVLDTLGLLSGLRDRQVRRNRVRELLEQVGLEDVASRKVKKLSGGMVRRLGVAQALVHSPQVLVVDEPTVGLDPQERLRFRKLMAKLAKDRVIVLSTHIVADLGSGCNDLALIDSGKIVFRGSPAELVSRAGGRVFELVLQAGGDESRLAGAEIVSRTRDGDGTRIRAVSSDGSLPEGGRPVDDPTLEEGYLAFMAARGRAEAVLAEEDA